VSLAVVDKMFGGEVVTLRGVFYGTSAPTRRPTTEVLMAINRRNWYVATVLVTGNEIRLFVARPASEMPGIC
jgi:hypothetical protein